MEEDYEKAFKKLILFFLSNPVSFNGQDYEKQKGSGTSDQSLFNSLFHMKITVSVTKCITIKIVNKIVLFILAYFVLKHTLSSSARK